MGGLHCTDLGPAAAVALTCPQSGLLRDGTKQHSIRADAAHTCITVASRSVQICIML
jgi:hypothetical protein